MPPETRSQLVRLLRARARSASAQPATDAESGPAPLLLDASSPSEPDALKASYKQFYDSVSAQLNATAFGQFSYFLNYGYVPDGGPDDAVVELPEHFINKNSVRLVLELIGDCPVDGRRVVDVGCGRGGTIYTLKTFFAPEALMGVDLSTTAVAFDQKAHGDERTSFRVGDAEELPLPDGSYDIVTNIESSHSYPNIHRFYTQVSRVLRPGGYFLYTDALSTQQIATSLAYLDHLGFELERNRNITPNVLLSCDEVAASRVQAFDQRNDQQLMQNFLATPGSQVYDEMRSGRWEYRIFRLRKRG
ncbi:MAG: methyltransferase domain-containing protein [Actinomycetota bacterium]|nr:methyltransferase domain-containing protein [Actinomycetota bacterium]